MVFHHSPVILVSSFIYVLLSILCYMFEPTLKHLQLFGPLSGSSYYELCLGLGQFLTYKKGYYVDVYFNFGMPLIHANQLQHSYSPMGLLVN